MSAHAKLSASGSSRWINCAGSVKAEEGLPDKPSVYAQEGIFAHEKASIMLNNHHLSIGTERLDEEMFYNSMSDVPYKMIEHIDYYLNYINTEVIKDFNPSVTSMYIEKVVDYSNVAPEGFGTADCIVHDKSTNELRIVDLKYGKGVAVYPENNTQLLLYAIGAINTLNINPSKITMDIVQPRSNFGGGWGITIGELVNKWIPFFTVKAKEALAPDAKRTPSAEACRWCKAKSTCGAFYGFVNETSLVVL